MKSIIFFLISFLSSILFLLIERVVGISWEYHPDAVTYITTYREMIYEFIQQGPISVVNNFYFFIVYFFSGSISALILFNIIIYSFTNVILYNNFNKYLLRNKYTNNYKKYFFYAWIIFLPYRLHLSNHVLKDTLIIFFLVILTSELKFKYFAWIPLLLIRVFSGFYLFSFIKKKYLIYIIVVSIVIFILFPFQMINLLSEKNDTSMTFREFDTIPTFQEYGLIGILLRSIFWPILSLTGFFIFLSPSFSFLPIFIGSLFTQIVSKLFFKKYAITLGIFFCFMIIALFVNGFTSYIRYTFPVIVSIPNILMFTKITEKNEYSKKVI